MLSKCGGLFLLLFCLQGAFAFTLIDANSGLVIESGYARIEGPVPQEFFIGPNESGPALAPEGLLLLRTFETGAFNYYAELNGGESTVLVQPAGLIIGQVTDGFSSNIVHVPLVIDCLTRHMVLTTDAVGKFRAVVPAERCQVTVSAQGRVGNAIVNVTQGELSDITVLVGTTQSKDIPWLIILAIFCAVIAIVFILRPNRIRDEPRKKVHAALTDKEKIIVDALMSRGGKLTVRELRFILQFPRTSLLRTLQGLEARGVLVKKEENGRLVVELLN